MYPTALHSTHPPTHPHLQVNKHLGKIQAAMRHFLLALDLDPKDGNMVKAAIDRLDEAEEEEEEKF